MHRDESAVIFSHKKKALIFFKLYQISEYYLGIFLLKNMCWFPNILEFNVLIFHNLRLKKFLFFLEDFLFSNIFIVCLRERKEIILKKNYTYFMRPISFIFYFNSKTSFIFIFSKSNVR